VILGSFHPSVVFLPIEGYESLSVISQKFSKIHKKSQKVQKFHRKFTEIHGNSQKSTKKPQISDF
jgi:hypothetical protein